ncbi:hypothetical protein B0H16DRAFT_1688341 [Mycena metata]|uniref:Uncharacterized protein n=1 Tax=Mycena metata TaxID=1033252 RepID=A0AAD7JEB2_9AGAR|nr:hypothetical protein B0H16DRAFT_1688341 [Mycena metata]
MTPAAQGALYDREPSSIEPPAARDHDEEHSPWILRQLLVLHPSRPTSHHRPTPHRSHPLRTWPGASTAHRLVSPPNSNPDSASSSKSKTTSAPRNGNASRKTWRIEPCIFNSDAEAIAPVEHFREGDRDKEEMREQYPPPGQPTGDTPVYRPSPNAASTHYTRDGSLLVWLRRRIASLHPIVNLWLYGKMVAAARARLEARLAPNAQTGRLLSALGPDPPVDADESTGDNDIRHVIQTGRLLSALGACSQHWAPALSTGRLLSALGPDPPVDADESTGDNDIRHHWAPALSTGRLLSALGPDPPVDADESTGDNDIRHVITSSSAGHRRVDVCVYDAARCGIFASPSRTAVPTARAGHLHRAETPLLRPLPSPLRSGQKRKQKGKKWEETYMHFVFDATMCSFLIRRVSGEKEVARGSLRPRTSCGCASTQIVPSCARAYRPGILPQTRRIPSSATTSPSASVPAGSATLASPTKYTHAARQSVRLSKVGRACAENVRIVLIAVISSAHPGRNPRSIVHTIPVSPRREKKNMRRRTRTVHLYFDFRLHGGAGQEEKQRKRGERLTQTRTSSYPDSLHTASRIHAGYWARKLNIKAGSARSLEKLKRRNGDEKEKERENGEEAGMAWTRYYIVRVATSLYGAEIRGVNDSCLLGLRRGTEPHAPAPTRLRIVPRRNLPPTQCPITYERHHPQYAAACRRKVRWFLQRRSYKIQTMRTSFWIHLPFFLPHRGRKNRGIEIAFCEGNNVRKDWKADTAGRHEGVRRRTRAISAQIIAHSGATVPDDWHKEPRKSASRKSKQRYTHSKSNPGSLQKPPIVPVVPQARADSFFLGRAGAKKIQTVWANRERQRRGVVVMRLLCPVLGLANGQPHDQVSTTQSLGRNSAKLEGSQPSFLSTLCSCQGLAFHIWIFATIRTESDGGVLNSTFGLPFSDGTLRTTTTFSR